MSCKITKLPIDHFIMIYDTYKERCKYLLFMYHHYPDDDDQHYQVGIASKTLGGGGNQMLPLPEKALSESMEKGGRKMQGTMMMMS